MEQVKVNGKPVQYDLLPERFRGGIERWIEGGIKPGHYLTAVLKNDLLGALCLADDDQTRNDIRALCQFLYNHAPPACFGSGRAVDSWKGCPR